MPYMKLEVETIIVDPVREIQAQRHAKQFLPENLRGIETALYVLQDVLVADLAARRR